MLSQEEQYILSKRLVQSALTVQKKARKGKDICCEVEDAMVLKIRMCTRDDYADGPLGPYRIFQDEFQPEFE